MTRHNPIKTAFFIPLMILIIAAIPQSTFAAQFGQSGQSGHMTLLAVSESSNGQYEGSTADLYLEIKPGAGRVFIDTFPITKLDTQMTTRYAKETACKFLDKNCEDLDFFYTINAQSSIIAGPSAGAATTLLTISLLGNIRLDQDTVMTGTINPGYLIGHVGGLKEKIHAAASNKNKKVLIPIGENPYNDTIANSTIDLIEYGRSLNISVVEVSDVYDAMHEFTGQTYKKNHSEIKLPKDYEQIMQGLADSLCNRTSILLDSINNPRPNTTEFEYTKNLTKNSMKEYANKKYYSAASLCFGANVNYLQEQIIESNLTSMEYKLRIIKAKNEADSFLEKIKTRSINTITDLEAEIIVQERLNDAKFYADQADSANSTREKSRLLAYSLERLNSAYLWDKFYGRPGQSIEFDKKTLQQSCQLKISEAEERYQYASLYFPDRLTEIKAEINHAYEYARQGEYEFCLFKATQAKARSNVILSSISVDTKKISLLLNQQLSAAESTISEQIEKGIFPVLGYSYYEYASTLKNDDELSALIYSQYALELSDLGMYFKKEKIPGMNLPPINYSILLVFMTGLLVGYAAHLLVARSEKKLTRGKIKKINNGKKRMRK